MQGRGQGGVESEVESRTLGGLHGRTRSVRGHLERGHPVQVLFPLVQLAIDASALQFAALPNGVVGALDGESREIGFSFLGARHVQGDELTLQHADGPGVRDDVVHGQEQDVVVGIEAQQGGAERVSVGEVEGDAGLLGQPEPCAPFAVGRVDVLHGGLKQRHRGGLVDDTARDCIRLVSDR